MNPFEPHRGQVRFEDAPLHVTRNPMTRAHGIAPGTTIETGEDEHGQWTRVTGDTCRDCAFLVSHGRWYKCTRRGFTHGAATDHRVGWPACGLFQLRADALLDPT